MKGTPTYTQVCARPSNTDEVITAGTKVYPRCFDRPTKETSDSFRSVILRLEPDFPRSVFARQPAPPLGSHRYGSVMRALRVGRFSHCAGFRVAFISLVPRIRKVSAPGEVFFVLAHAGVDILTV